MRTDRVTVAEPGADGRGAYVALGDSISIDDYAGGPGRGGASLLARNEDRDSPRWRGHGLTVGNPAQGDPRPADRDLWYCDVIEPNAWGASAVREAFWAALGHPVPTAFAGPASA